MILVALLLSWLPPVVDCAGAPLTDFDHYLLETERTIKIGEMMNPDGTQSDIVQRTFLAAPLPMNTSDAELTDPEVGGMIAWRLVAYDWAENRDCESEAPTP